MNASTARTSKMIVRKIICCKVERVKQGGTKAYTKTYGSTKPLIHKQVKLLSNMHMHLHSSACVLRHVCMCAYNASVFAYVRMCIKDMRRISLAALNFINVTYVAPTAINTLLHMYKKKYERQKLCVF